MIDENNLIAVFRILRDKGSEDGYKFWDQAIDIVNSIVPEPQSRHKGVWYQYILTSLPPKERIECSECGCQFDGDVTNKWKYCPICGSKNERF